MPTTLGRTYDVAWRGNPPHMLAPDVPVWYRWLSQYGPYIQALYYDSLLGGPFLTPAEELDPFKKMWRYNISKRTDAIAETSTEVWIIEVAAYPGLRAVGQLQVYQTLWIENPKIIKPEHLVLVAERIDPDLGAACGKFGIQVYLV